MLILEDPFFGALSLRMRLRPMSGDQIEQKIVNHSCVVDGKQIVYDPKFAEKMNLLEAMGLLAHEVAHVALKHNLRRGDRNWKLWNMAGDYVIDPILKSAGFKLPDVYGMDEDGNINIVKGHFHDEFAGKSVEEVYEILLARQKATQQTQKEAMQKMLQQMQDQDGEDGDDFVIDDDFNEEDDDNAQKISIPPRLSDIDEDDDDENGSGDEDSDDGPAQNGGEIDFGDLDIEDMDIPNLPGTGAVLDFPVNMNDNTEKDKADEEQTLAIEDAMRAAKMHGTMNADLKRLIDAGKEHKIFWYDELRDFMEKVTERGDYSWISPSRRYISHGFVLPGLAEDEILPNIVVVCDTSGSIGDHELEQYAAEISNVLEEFDCRFTVIYCDTRVQHTEEFTIDDLPLKLDAKGGGGTYFMPAFRHIEENFQDAEAIVFFTDMDAFDWTEIRNYDPKRPVLWLDSYDGKVVNRPGFQLPFGKHILLETEEPEYEEKF
jgi:predicted metal-dependent peptidase